MSRPDYCPIGNEPCQSMCDRPCSPNPELLIDSEYASRLAFMLECLIVDYHGHWNAACKLLDEYKAEWEKVNPSPPTFMGEPMPPYHFPPYGHKLHERSVRVPNDNHPQERWAAMRKWAVENIIPSAAAAIGAHKEGD